MSDIVDWSSIQISLASPEQILSWSHGEVTKSETINYRTMKPEPDGLFCEKIFGPEKDYQCYCGKYKKNKHQRMSGTLICETCGVEVAPSSVRRERMGHINLAVPVAHIWYFKGGKIALATGMQNKDIEGLLYYTKHLITKLDSEVMKEENIKAGDLVDDEQLVDLRMKYGKKAIGILTGGEAVTKLLSDIDLEKTAAELQKIVDESRSKDGVSNKQLADKAKKRLLLIKSFIRSNARPEWMMIKYLPVLPASLRPMIPLDGGRVTSSDLNELYRKVINDNSRIKKSIENKAPEVMLNSEKRKLQEIVDALIDNSKKAKPVKGTQDRALKSLTDNLKGKQGRFRYNLLGKRVDYSGRSVIVVGPELKMYQCGLPKDMAKELFKPFIVGRLTKLNPSLPPKTATGMVDRGTEEVYDALADVIKDHPVLLNRAPTLHRLGIQAFEPVLVDGNAIRLHPLVCTAFNADFDGDQMAVHVPLSQEAQAEARMLMLATNNILKLSDGASVVSPTQDMLLGTYYMTQCDERIPGKKDDKNLRIFKDPKEAILAYQLKQISMREPIMVRLTKKIDGEIKSRRIRTTVGRLIFNSYIPQDLGFNKREGDEVIGLEINTKVNKKLLSAIVLECYKKHGATKTAEVLDAIKKNGYKYSTIAGITANIYDMKTPKEEENIIKEAQRDADSKTEAYLDGLLTENGRTKEILDIWTKAKNECVEEVKKAKDEYNDIWMMVDSGARGSIGQLAQIVTMKGLVESTTGVVELPVKSSYRKGLSVLEYFIAAHTTRKTLSDTALKTADSGYLTRKLVEVAHDVIITEEKCSDTRGREVAAIYPKSIKSRIRKEKLFFDIDVDVTDAEGNILYTKDEFVPKVFAADMYETYDKPLFKKNTAIDQATVDKILNDEIPEISVLSLDGKGDIFAAKNGEYYTVNMATGKAEKVSKDAKLVANSIAIARAVLPLSDRIRGRVAFKEIRNPLDPSEIFTAAEEMITDEAAIKIENAGITKVWIRTALSCGCKDGICAKCYGRNMASTDMIQEGEAVGVIAAQSIGEPGTQLTMRTFHQGGVASASSEDITKGLPRVKELLENSKPKKDKAKAVIAKLTGIITKITDKEIVIESVDKAKSESHPHNIEERNIYYGVGDAVKKGDILTPGVVELEELFEQAGRAVLQDYIIAEILSVYNEASVKVNPKHVEIIVRQMTKNVVILDRQDTDFLEGEIVDSGVINEINAKLISENKRPAKMKILLQGIVKSALASKSFLAAASFQETSKILTDAAIRNRIDPLKGLMENVLAGRLIPAGTGYEKYKDLEVQSTETVMNIEETRQFVDSAYLNDEFGSQFAESFVDNGVK